MKTITTVQTNRELDVEIEDREIIFYGDLAGQRVKGVILGLHPQSQPGLHLVQARMLTGQRKGIEAPLDISKEDYDALIIEAGRSH